tara:strand:+ start:26 stop:484 length:459 start_codon:yes stop_codon:yes gene_type:complete
MKNLLKNFYTNIAFPDSEYLTLYNFRRPYSIKICNENNVFITNNETNEKICNFNNVKKIFIGIDPNDAKLNGNTFLIQTESLKYVFISHQIYIFISESKIMSYISEVDSNNIPLAKATDKENNTYIMSEKVFIKNDNKLKKHKINICKFIDL